MKNVGEGGYPHLYIMCKKIFRTDMPKVFSVSAMLSYYISYQKWDEGKKYIHNLGLDELQRSKLNKAFISYEKAC